MARVVNDAPWPTGLEPTRPRAKAAPAAADRPARFASSLHSEWIKLTTVRSARVILALTIAVGGTAAFMVAYATGALLIGLAVTTRTDP